MAPPFPPNSSQHRQWSRDGFLISTDPSLIPPSSLSEAFASDMLYWAKPLPEEAMREMLAGSLTLGVYAATGEIAERTDGGVDEDGGLSVSVKERVGAVMHEIAGRLPHGASGNGGEHLEAQPSEHHVPDSTAATTTATATALAKTTATARDSPSPSPALIGLARCITDNVTFLYLTDVYILPAWQAQGLGKWLINCVQELVDDMPYLRRSMAVIGGRGEGEREMARKEAFHRGIMRLSSDGGGGGRIVQCRGNGSALKGE